MPNDPREQLLIAARELFLRDGYRAGVDAIAAAAGVSKQTLYNHFGSKEALFSAVMSACVQNLTVPLAGQDGLRDALLRFALSFRGELFSPESLALHRMLIAETPRFPELAREVFLAGPCAMHDQLAQVLARAMAAGTLRQEEPRFAADMLVSMLLGFERQQRLFGIQASAEPEPERCAHIIDTYLRAFAPAPTPST